MNASRPTPLPHQASRIPDSRGGKAAFYLEQARTLFAAGNLSSAESFARLAFASAPWDDATKAMVATVVKARAEKAR